MHPVIGITCYHLSKDVRMVQNETYVEAVKKAGGAPILLPCVKDAEYIGAMLNRIDGLLIAGGPDVHPLHFNEEPHPNLGNVEPLMDDFEIELIKQAIATKKPILGICRGVQSLNIAMGGTIYQDIPAQVPNALQHRQFVPRHRTHHSASVDTGSRLFEIFAEREIRVNSFHHQSIKDVAPGFVATVHAPDGIIEAIEMQNRDHFVVGLQWHPECMWNAEYNYDKLFDTFIEEARKCC